MNKWPEAEVARILRDYGEERRWRHLAHKIVEQRLAGGIHTTAELVELIGGSTFGTTSNPQLMACFISEFFFSHHWMRSIILVEGITVWLTCLLVYRLMLGGYWILLTTSISFK